jgi:restriction endonuclease Mrr
VPGFIRYAAFRTGDGGITVTMCEDKAGTDESSKRAAGWVEENVDGTVDPPRISEGSALLEF